MLFFWINLAKDRDKWLAVVDKNMNIQRIKDRNVLPS
jgi:hypothetical protein